ncbi:unnamed protein product, partial [Hymenolepis diminuta]
MFDHQRYRNGRPNRERIRLNANLISAVMENNADEVRICLMCGNHLDVVKILLNRANTDIDRSVELNEAYSNALLVSSNEMIETLLSAGADVNYFEIPGVLPLFIAIGRRNLDCIKTLQRYGADHNQVDDDGYNALMYSVLLENLEAVEYFLSIGSDLNVRTSADNLTALGLAEKGEDGRIMEILMEAQ